MEHYIINEIQKIYIPEGSPINDKHVEIIVRQMFGRVLIREKGDTDLMVGDMTEKSRFLEINRAIKKAGKEPAKAEQKVLGITTVSLTTESFLSAASFQQTPRVLVAAACEGKVDKLRGLKENVIIGKLIPGGTGLNPIPQEKIDELRKILNPEPLIIETPPEAVASAEKQEEKPNPISK